MKFQILTAILVFATSFSFGQGKFGANEEDSLKCLENLSVYKNPYYKNKQYKEAVVYWRVCLETCPKVRKSLYTDGNKMYKAFIKEATDDARKVELIDTLLWLYDQRIEHFGQEGYVKGRKGAAMLKYKKDEPAKAEAVLAEAYALEKNNLEAGAVVAYYTAMYKVYRADKSDENKLRLLEAFPKLAAVCEHQINTNEKEKTKTSYTKALGNIEKYFSSVATCADLVSIYSKKFEETPDDKDNLKAILSLFDKRDCAAEPLYLEVAKKLQSIEPSAEAAFAIAQSEAKEGKYTEAITYYNQTIEMTEDVEVKAKAYLNASRCYLSTKQAQSAVSYARKGIGVKPSLGAAYIVIGDAYSQAKGCGDNDCTKRAKYWAAYDMYAKAKAVDSEVASKAANKMAQAKKQFPLKTDCFFHSISPGDSYTLSCWVGVTTEVRVRD